MPTSPQNPSNRYDRSTWLAWGALLAVFVYIFAFFSQPSLYGFVDEAGEPLPRWVDLSMILLVDQLLGGLTGHGRFEATVTDRLPILLAGLAWLGVAWSTGRWGLAWSKLSQQLSSLERHALSVLAGLAVLSTWTLVVGLAGGLGSRLPLLISVLVAVAGSVWLRRFAGVRPFKPVETHSAIREQTDITPLLVANDLDRWSCRLMILGVCGLGLMIVWGTLMTPWEFDVVEYHLQAPKEYLQAGVIGFNERNVYANMPLGAEMHTLAMMTLIGRETPDAWWLGGLVGKFVIGSYSWLAALLVGGFIGRHFGRLCGWASAGCLLAVPGGVHVATAGLIDSVVGAYVLAVVVVWSLDWSGGGGDGREAGASESALPGRSLGTRGGGATWAIGLASLFAGAAAAAKYPGFVFAVVPLMLAVLGWELRQRFTMTQRLWHAGAAFVGLLLTCIPWLAKNWWQAGNPVYPLMTGLFGGRGLNATEIEQWRSAHAVPMVDGTAYGIASIAQSLYQLTLGSPFLSPVSLALAACGTVVLAAQWRQWRWLWIWPLLAAWIVLVWFVATHRIDRFWLPVIPLYAGLAGLGVHWLGRQLTAAVPAGLVLLGVGYCAFLLVAGNLGDNRLLAPLAELRIDAGSDDGPGRIARSTGWVNKNLNPKEHKLLLIGEARVYDFVPPIEYSTCFNDSLAEELLRDQSPEEQRQNLAEQGITHIMIHWGEIARYRSPGNYGFSSWPQPADIEQMIASGVVELVEWPIDPQLVMLLRVQP